jgi:hypothetical protein
MGKKPKNKRVVILSDLHAGHVAGLTPPSWTASGRLAEQTEPLRRACWEWYNAECKKLGTVDLCIVNGDAIDGRGEASGSRELISVDRHDQCDIAVAAIQQTRAKQYALTFGTPYHTGKSEDFERCIAEKLGTELINDQLWLDVNGVVFDCKHKVGGSGVPYGRHTAVAKERLWNMIWNDLDEGQPRADIFIRSHVHYHNYCGGIDWLGLTTPALQAAGTVYGGRQCTGTVDFGFLVFDVNEKGEYTWQAKIAKLKQQRALISRI